MAQALDGLRVVELDQMVSAPYCAKLFADYGAEVIKVEPPGGDVCRRWGPFPGDAPDPEKSGLFFFLNTNKRGVTLDAESPAGREDLLVLLRDADVFIESNPPSRMRELGLDYRTLAKLNSDLVMISLTPFGQTGPYSDWKGYDLNAFHLTGAGHRYLGRPGEAPLEPGSFVADFFGGVAGAAWGLAAVTGRAQAGGGQHVDVSCAEVIAALFTGCQNVGAYAQDGVFERRSGVGMRLGAPATILPCKDGHVWMLALESGQWRGLAHAMGDPDWTQLEMFLDMFTRAQNAEAMYPLIQQWTVEHRKQEIMDVCQANGCPATAVYTVAEAADHPHLKARDYIVPLSHPALGSVRTLGAPIKLPACPGGPRAAAPLLGQHNGQTFASPGFDAPPAARNGSLPLSGLRVANFGVVWLGPVVGQTLAFLGAEVYKIESRARIDLNRQLPPFGGGIRDPDRSISNHAAWAGNGSVTLNLKKPEAQELAKRLVAASDVVLENYGPGIMDKFGLGYEALCAVRPDIIMVSMPPAGLYGPLNDIRTYGMSLSSITGLDSLSGYIGGPPIPFENAFADPYGGMMGTFATLLALNHRQRTGQGQHVDYSQQEGVMQLVSPAIMDYFLNGRVAGVLENRHPLATGAPHGVFPCAGDDRWISIAVLTGEEWAGLTEAMGSPDWARAPEFATGPERLKNIDALHARIADWTAEFNDRELAATLQRHGVAAAPVLSAGDLLDDPHYRARGTFIEVEHPLAFRETIYGAYVKTSRSRVDVRSGPMIGRDNDHVFRELLGLPEDEYQHLIEEQVIF